MSIRLLIDFREKQILENITVPFIKQNLHIGDIQILKDEIPIVIIERKTHCDLRSGIASRRYAEQRERLLKYRNENPNVLLVYLFENFNEPQIFFNDKNSQERVLGAIENLVLYHKIQILPTSNISESVICIEHIFSKIQKKCPGDPEKNVLIKSSQQSRKSQITCNMFCQQLMLIDGVSVSVAQIIVEVYPHL